MSGKIRVPRKKKKQIPDGLLCCKKVGGWKYFGEGKIGFHVKYCPFFRTTKIVTENTDRIQERSNDDAEEQSEYQDSCSLLKTSIYSDCKQCNIKLDYESKQ